MSSYDMRGFEEHCAREEAALRQEAQEIEELKSELVECLSEKYREVLDAMDADDIRDLYATHRVNLGEE